MKPRDQILVRMYLVFAALCMLPIFIGVKIAGIHLLEGAELREAGTNQSNTLEEIPAVRGSILDSAGRSLAVNAARFDLEVDPTVDGFSENSSYFYRQLTALFDRTPDFYKERVDNRASPKYVLLLRQINDTQKKAIESWKIPGLFCTIRNMSGNTTTVLRSRMCWVMSIQTEKDLPVLKNNTMMF